MDEFSGDDFMTVASYPKMHISDIHFHTYRAANQTTMFFFTEPRSGVQNTLVNCDFNYLNTIYFLFPVDNASV